MSDIVGLAPLVSLPIRDFISYLNTQHALGLTSAEIDRASQVLQEQWFNNAEELRVLDNEAFGFLPLPKQLPTCILAFFSPTYNPKQLYPPLGSAHAAVVAAAASAVSPSATNTASSQLHLPVHAHSANAETTPMNTNGLTTSQSAQQLHLPRTASPAASTVSPHSHSPSCSHHHHTEESKEDPHTHALITNTSRMASEGNSTTLDKSLSSHSSSSSSVAAPSSSTNGYNLDLVALEGGINEGNGDESSRENSRNSSGEGNDDESSTDIESGSEEHDGHANGSGDDVDQSAAAKKKSRKKWDRHSSLIALKKAVDHVCASSTKEEHVLLSLQNILRAAMQKSGKHTQNTLRELMKKLQDKLTEQGGDPSAMHPPATLASTAKSMSASPSELALNGSPPPTSPSPSLSTSSSSSAFGFTCGVCHGAKDKSVLLECGHKFCGSCIRDHVNGLVGQKQAVGIKCPYTSGDGATCTRELSTATIQNLLSPSDFENYLNATLASFIESDDCLTVTCPNPKCNSIMSVEPLKNPHIPKPMTEKDEDGRLLTNETYLHFIEYRVRCRAEDCNTNFCAKCRAQPYHKGYTCAGYKDYLAARHCRFCESKLTPAEAAKLSHGIRDVCSEKECQEKSVFCCDKILACGCACNGIRNEAECLPCLKHDLKIEDDEYCGICYVESLKAAPCLQLKGPCTHTFHYTCLKQKLEAKWPNARIGFEFTCCPLCKQAISHPALEAILVPIKTLEASIKEKSLQRLKFESRDKDPAIVNANGAYYNDPTGFAMKQYLFYICYTCKLPYFAGGYQCQEANEAFDPAELICPGCQPASVEDCATHGRDWLAYKCRYCCSFANWTCWGNTRFCDKCHKSGVWQNLAIFRTGKNKKKLWEYDQCATLQKPVEAIGKENISEEEKNAKIAKLLCQPRSCPLGVRHPPNGLEFGLGCSMCEDREAIGSAQALVEAIRAKLTTVKAELTKAPRVFTHTSDFDLEGVFFYLGTCGKTQPWSNPAEAGFVKIGSSGAMNDSAPLSSLVGRDLVRLVTQPQRNSWFSWELIDLQLCLTHYTLKHYNTWDTECLRNWSLEGSNDGGAHWEVISTHTNDIALDKKGATHTWTVDSHGKKYSMFRILQTGRNSNNNFYLALSGSEFYGELSLAPPKEAVVLPPASSAGKLILSPRSDFDENGLMYYLGTRGGKQPWRNPAEIGQVIVACSELAAGPPPSSPTSAVVGREVVRCVSAAKPNQWFVIDLTPSGKRIKPSHYSLRHYNSWDLEALRNWRFEGSANGIDWYVLSVHLNDTSLDRKGATHTWALPGCQVVCAMFRIWQTGLNSNNHHYLALSGFEVYGTVEDAPVVNQPVLQQRPALMQQPSLAAGGFIQAAPQPPPVMLSPEQQLAFMANQQRQQQQFWVPPTPLIPLNIPNVPDSGMVVLKYASDMDQNGLMYWLGSQGRRAQWRNPAEAGLVNVRCSELAVAPPSMPASAICGREAVRCCSVGKPDMYFLIDLRDKAMALTHYTLVHYTSWDTEALRNWKLEGSNDGARWDLLRAHRDDRVLDHKGQAATWPVVGVFDRFYRMFKITMTGPNSNNNHYLALSGFEAYGILQVWPTTGTPEAKAAQAAAVASGYKTDSVDVVRQYQQQLKSSHVASYTPQQPMQQPPHLQHQGSMMQLQPPAFLSQHPPSAQPPMQPLSQVPHHLQHLQQQLAPHPQPPQAAVGSSSAAPALASSSSSISSSSSSAISASLSPSVSSSALVPSGSSNSKFGPPPYRSFEDGMEFVYQCDLDANGVMYYLGTQRWTKPWQNPAEIGAVQVTSVPLATQPKSEPASAIVGRSLCRCVTLPNRESWFVIDLLTLWIRPTAYTLRHYDSFDTEALRDWKLQGSNDGKKWTKLLSHKKDESLEGKGSTKTWAIPKPKKAYRMLRILQTGRNSNNHWYCALSSFEIYGKLYSFKK